MKSIKGTKTEQNLLKAFAGESQARTRYTFFASVAKKEGFEQISAIFTETAEQTFRMVAKVEVEHEKRYRRLYKRVIDGTVFEREEETEWQCRNCGYVHRGKNAPATCPVCQHPQAFFEEEKQNY